jgi:hypothetical protein
MTTSPTSMDGRFVVYVNKNCSLGPYLDPSEVQKLPEYFQERSVHACVKNIMEAIVLTGYNIKEVFSKVPRATVESQDRVAIEVQEDCKDGKKKTHHCKLQIIDRKQKGIEVLKRFLQNLETCPGFLTNNQPKGNKACKECRATKLGTYNL